MKRDAFLSELKTALTGHLSENETIEILADYEEFFESGLAEGETEEQIAERLGHPARIALSLINKKPQNDEIAAVRPPAAYKQFAALITDILFSSLPILFFSLKIAILTFFYPQLIANMLRSFFSTVLISNHTWIAGVRFFWLAAVCLSGVWWLFVNPLSMLLFKGKTIGMKLAGLAVVSNDGGKASLIQYFIREWIGKLCINMLFGFIWQPLAFLPLLASLLLAVITKNGLTVWDAIAGTRMAPVQKNRLKTGL